MSDILDRETRNALVRAVHKAIVATFNEGDWRSLGFQTDTLPFIERHARLLRSLSWKDQDYPEHAMTAVTKIVTNDFANLGIMIEDAKVLAWLRENEPVLYVRFFGGDEPIDAVPPIDHATVVQKFLWRGAADASLTKAFRSKRHDDVLDRLQNKADAELPGRPGFVNSSRSAEGGATAIDRPRLTRYCSG